MRIRIPNTALRWSSNSPTFFGRFRREGSVASDGPGSAGHQQASAGTTSTSTPANYGIPGSYSTNFHLPMPEEQVVWGLGSINKKTWGSVTILTCNTWRFVSSPPRRRVESVRRSGRLCCTCSLFW
jgi:hypothetical protein